MATAAAKRTHGLRGVRVDAVIGRELAIDVGLALASFALAIGLMASGGFATEEPDARGLDALGVLLALGSSAPLLVRRRAIVPAFVVLFTAYAATAALGYPIGVVFGPLIGLYTLAGAAGRSVSRWLALALAVASYLAIFAAIAIGYDLARIADGEAVVFVLVWMVIWTAGERSQLRREHVAELEERAERAEREAERERRLAAAEERTRIARDLHDSAGHAINVILVEAGAARLLKDRDPERAEQALKTIEEVAREQIREIDRLVHALRADDPDDEYCPPDGPPAGPTSSIVPRGPESGRALFERMRASGLELEVERIGEARRLGPNVGRAMFRILQEGLTNATRHGPGSASVVMRFRDDAIDLTITNPTRSGSQASGEGHGLTGMRERVGLLGGDFEAGQSNGVFRVRAVLPYDRTFEARLANWRQDP